MRTVGNLLLKHQFHQFLGRRGHILEPLSERNYREAHALKVLHHLDGTPSVEGNLPDVVQLTEPLDEFFDIPVVDNIAFRGLEVALTLTNILWHMIPSHTKCQVIFWNPEVW